MRENILIPSYFRILRTIFPIRITTSPFKISIFPTFISTPTFIPTLSMVVWPIFTALIGWKVHLLIIHSFELHFLKTSAPEPHDIDTIGKNPYEFHWNNIKLFHNLCHVLYSLFFLVSVCFFNSLNGTGDTRTSQVYHALLINVVPSISWASIA